MKFAHQEISGKRTASEAARAAFTLAEVLAALLFMAIVIPVAVEGLHIASLAGKWPLAKAKPRGWPNGC